MRELSGFPSSYELWKLGTEVFKHLHWFKINAIMIYFTKSKILGLFHFYSNSFTKKKKRSSWADCLSDDSLLFALLRIPAFLVSSSFLVSMRARRRALLQMVHRLFPKAALKITMAIFFLSSLLLMQSISSQSADLVKPFRIGNTENLSICLW